MTVLRFVATGPQREILDYRGKFRVLVAGRRWGKRLSVDTLLPTPDGFIRNGDVEPGQKLIGSRGQSVTVTQAHPIELAQDTYLVTFDTGEQIHADAEHLWPVIGARERKNAARRRELARYCVLNTRTIAQQVRLGKEANYAIPVVAFQGQEKPLPVHPYMLGVWLGNGSTTAPLIACPAGGEEVFVRLRGFGYVSSKVVWNKPKTKNAKWMPSMYMKDLHHGLNGLGLVGESHANGKRENISEKRIPEMYFLASMWQRLELLRGLMDTDGYTDGVRCELCLSDERLASDAFRLIRSLGIKARMAEYASHLTLPGKTRKKCKNRFRMVFYRYADQEPVFTLARKQDRIPTRGRSSGQDWRFIVSCERAKPAMMRCLTVDAGNSLYCATEAFIATHNTIGVIANDVPMRCLERPKVEYLMTAPSLPQVKICYDTIVSSVPLSRFIAHVELKHYPLITWYNGSRAHFRTLDQPDLLRGAAYDYIWADEIQNVREWVINRVLLPCLADRRGKLGMSGQGRGEEHWLFQNFFMPGQKVENWNWIRAWKFSIRDGIRFQDEAGKAELEQLRSVTPPDIWEEEYEGNFVSSGRAAFATQDIQACIRGSVQTGPIAGHRYILACDIGRIADPTAFVLLDSTACAVAHAEVRPLREHAAVSAQHAEILRQKFDALCVVDKTGYGVGSASRVDEYVREYERFVKRLVPFLWSPATKKRYIDCLALGIQKHLLGIPQPLTELRRQLGVYEYTKKGEHVVCSAPQGDHDDLVSAMAMAFNAYELGWGNGMEKVAATALQGIL